MQYSALEQINKNNVKQLQEAWFFPVPSDPPYERLPFNPLCLVVAAFARLVLKPVSRSRRSATMASQT